MSMVKFQKADIVRKAVIFYKVAAFFILNIRDKKIMEDFETALSREVLEEGGLILCPGSMQLLGEIEEKRRDLFETDKIYHCHTYFFACAVEERTTEPHMTES